MISPIIDANMVNSSSGSSSNSSRLVVLPDLIIEHILLHINSLFNALCFTATCRDLRVLSLRAGSYWQRQYREHFGDSSDEKRWIHWQRTRHDFFQDSNQDNHTSMDDYKLIGRISPLCWYTLLCQRGVLERQWKKGRWRPGGVRVRAIADRASDTTSSSSLNTIQLVGHDSRFILLADHIRGRLLLVEPDSPARMVELQRPSSIMASDWPVKLGSVTFSEDWLATVNAVDMQTIYIWRLHDGHLMKERSTPWTIPCHLTSLDNWLLIQPARSDPPIDPNVAFDDHAHRDPHVIELNGRPAVQAIVHYVSDDEDIRDVDASWPLPAALSENGQPQYCILPSSSNSKDTNRGPVELSVYFSVGTLVYWAHLQADPFSSNRTMLSTNYVAATIIKEGHFHANTPLLGNIMCWPIGTDDTRENGQRVLLLDSYGDEVGQRYFFIRIRTTKKSHKDDGDDDHDDHDDVEEGGEGEGEEEAQQPGTSPSRGMHWVCDTNHNRDIDESNRGLTEERRLEIERPTWIAVHSLGSGETLWQRTMRSECRHRLLPLPASNAILCTFDRGALLLDMQDGEVRRIFRASGSRLALHPVHVIGSICMIWAEDGKSIFCVDIRQQRVPRRALPSHWPAVRKLATLASNTSDADGKHHRQLAVGTSFLVMVQGDSARWILFNQLLQP